MNEWITQNQSYVYAYMYIYRERKREITLGKMENGYYTGFLYSVSPSFIIIRRRIVVFVMDNIVIEISSISQ